MPSVVSPSIQNISIAEPPNIQIAKADSGASDHYWMSSQKHCMEKIQSTDGPPIQLPNQEFISATEEGQLPLPSNLSTSARTAKILPNLRSSNLISVGKLCDNDCNVFFNKKQCRCGNIKNYY